MIRVRASLGARDVLWKLRNQKKNGFLFFWIVFFGLLRTVDADRETEGEREEEN